MWFKEKMKGFRWEKERECERDRESMCVWYREYRCIETRMEEIDYKKDWKTSR